MAKEAVDISFRPVSRARKEAAYSHPSPLDEELAKLDSQDQIETERNKEKYKELSELLGFITRLQDSACIDIRGFSDGKVSISFSSRNTPSTGNEHRDCMKKIKKFLSDNHIEFNMGHGTPVHNHQNPEIIMSEESIHLLWAKALGKRREIISGADIAIGTPSATPITPTPPVNIPQAGFGMWRGSSSCNSFSTPPKVPTGSTPHER